MGPILGPILGPKRALDLLPQVLAETKKLYLSLRSYNIITPINVLFDILSPKTTETKKLYHYLLGHITPINVLFDFLSPHTTWPEEIV